MHRRCKGHVAIVPSKKRKRSTVRLADEAAIHAASRGIRVHWGRCFEDGGAPAYWPWIQVLRRIIADAGSEYSRALPADIVRMLPELAAHRTRPDFAFLAARCTSSLLLVGTAGLRSGRPACAVLSSRFSKRLTLYSLGLHDLLLRVRLFRMRGCPRVWLAGVICVQHPCRTVRHASLSEATSELRWI